ncbi:hypothetical protein KIPB_007383 [Kipferlia bialata]|uniref:Guanylate cyclase domain-containing protein n=1 Tax=Kipferlia bialata TaxID=797122 RepID=A0A9K3CYH0_9EUKA|nr:hypothetical protein KIPB_007383 [Kipferlia bialata]|eukprot:g7383.t1
MTLTQSQAEVNRYIHSIYAALYPSGDGSLRDSSKEVLSHLSAPSSMQGSATRPLRSLAMTPMGTPANANASGTASGTGTTGSKAKRGKTEKQNHEMVRMFEKWYPDNIDGPSTTETTATTTTKTEEQAETAMLMQRREREREREREKGARAETPHARRSPHRQSTRDGVIEDVRTSLISTLEGDLQPPKAAFPVNGIDPSQTPPGEGIEESSSVARFAREEEYEIMKRHEIEFFPLMLYAKLDIVGFTKYCTDHGGGVVSILNILFSAFDEVVADFATAGVVKVKTIGDAYELMRPFTHEELQGSTLAGVVAAVGSMAEASFRLVQCAQEVFSSLQSPLNIRCGVALGPGFGAVLGRYRVSYDIFGLAPARARVMEELSPVGKVTVSRNVYDVLRGRKRRQRKTATRQTGNPTQPTSSTSIMPHTHGHTHAHAHGHAHGQVEAPTQAQTQVDVETPAHPTPDGEGVPRSRSRFIFGDTVSVNPTVRKQTATFLAFSQKLLEERLLSRTDGVAFDKAFNNHAARCRVGYTPPMPANMLSTTLPRLSIPQGPHPQLPATRSPFKVLHKDGKASPSAIRASTAHLPALSPIPERNQQQREGEKEREKERERVRREQRKQRERERERESDGSEEDLEVYPSFHEASKTSRPASARASPLPVVTRSSGTLSPPRLSRGPTTVLSPLGGVHIHTREGSKESERVEGIVLLDIRNLEDDDILE